MPTQHEIDEAAVRRQLENLVDAVRTRDLERLDDIYAPGIVSFDVEPPLQHLGPEGKRANWERAFAAIRPPIEYEVRDLSISVDGDLAFTHGLARLSGNLPNGQRGGFWVRATSCFQRVDGVWRIVHDHASVPLDIATGRGLTTLEP